VHRVACAAHRAPPRFRHFVRTLLRKALRGYNGADGLPRLTAAKREEEPVRLVLVEGKRDRRLEQVLYVANLPVLEIIP
jgi:hypothetical protein